MIAIGMESSSLVKTYAGCCQRMAIRYSECDQWMTDVCRTKGAEFCISLLGYLLRVEALFKCFNKHNLRYIVWWCSEHELIGPVLKSKATALIHLSGVRQIALFVGTRLEDSLIDAVIKSKDSMFDYPSEKQDKRLVKQLVKGFQIHQASSQLSYAAYRSLVSRDRSRLSLQQLQSNAAHGFIPAQLDVMLSRGKTRITSPLVDYITSIYKEVCPKADYSLPRIVLSDCDIEVTDGLSWNIASTTVGFNKQKIKGYSTHILYLLLRYGFPLDVDQLLEYEIDSQERLGEQAPKP